MMQGLELASEDVFITMLLYVYMLYTGGVERRERTKESSNLLRIIFVMEKQTTKKRAVAEHAVMMGHK